LDRSPAWPHILNTYANIAVLATAMPAPADEGLSLDDKD